ncbi:PD-(D/E)XK nuclease superfamily protein [compost metagenome]
MIISYMSASRIKTYLQCANKYHEQYENKVRGSADHLVFGTLMHSVFERFYQEEKDIKDIYQEEWDKADITDLQFYKDGFDILENFRLMNTKEESNVPLGYEYAFAIDIVTGASYDASVVDFELNPEGSKEFLKMLEDLDTPIIYGFIDRICYDIETDTLRIIDYKTSRVAMSQYESDSDIQMSMYALVAKYLFKDYEKVQMELHYVREGNVVTTTRTAEDLDIFRDWLISIFYKIRNDNEHKATLNGYCGWCEAKDVCDAYQSLVKGEAEDVSISQLSDQEMDEQLEKINIHIKILKGRKEEIESSFKERLKNSDNTPINTGTGERYITNNTRLSYSVGTVLSVLPEYADKILTVNKKEVDTLIKGNKELEQLLVDTGRKYYIEPTLRKKSSKPKKD